MYSYIFICFLMLTAASCQNQQYRKLDEVAAINANSVVAVAKPEEIKPDGGEIVEFFSDDSKIGSPHKNKIELSEFKKSDGNAVEIKFYSLAKNKEWKLKQKFEFKKNTAASCDVKLTDFNNDGFRDMTYVSAEAARGANEIRRLFIYDAKKDELVYIKNSEEYPNIRYNKKLNCIDAWRFYGGTSTDFLKIEGDSLKEFASVESFGDKRTVSLIDKNGKEKTVRTDKIKEDGYDRYENFNPPEPYRESLSAIENK